MFPRKLVAAHRSAGVSATELMVVCAILGVLATISIPFFISYYQSAALKAAAAEVAALLNQGRQVAIKENQSVCVKTASASLRLHVDGCAGTVWVGPGTDSSGNMSLPHGFTLAASAQPVFTYLGAAIPAATFTVTNSQDGRTLRVTVAAAGRITIGP